MIENLGKFGKSRIVKLSNKIWGESKKNQWEKAVVVPSVNQERIQA